MLHRDAYPVSQNPAFQNERIGLKMTRGGVFRATSRGMCVDIQVILQKIPGEDRCLEPLKTRTSGDVNGGSSTDPDKVFGCMGYSILLHI